MKILLCLILALACHNANAGKSSKRAITNSQTEAYALWDIDNQQLLTEKNSAVIRPMASITKLMTVLVTLELNLDLEQPVTVTGSERSSKIRSGMIITRRELIDLALVASDNLAARTLSETSTLSYEDFISKMNSTAVELEMMDTQYSDSTGLLAKNVSTPNDIAKLIQRTEHYTVFKQNAMRSKTIVTAWFKNKLQTITATNTNSFAGKLDLIGAKTGYTNPAGRCLTMFFNQGGHKYILVVLGAQSPEQRRKMVNQLLDKVV